MTSRPGRKMVVLVFSGYVLLWSGGTSGPQPVCRQEAGGRAKGVRLAVFGGARVAPYLARYGETWSRGRHRAGAARWGACCGGRWGGDGSRGSGGAWREGPYPRRAARWERERL